MRLIYSLTATPQETYNLSTPKVDDTGNPRLDNSDSKALI